MERSCLVTGKSTDLVARVVQESVGRSRRVLVGRSGPVEIPGTDTDAVSAVVWNRRSALSAKSVLMHAQNLFRGLPEAIVCYAPSRESVPFHESSIVAIEDRVDAEIKGYVFLLREIVSLFQRQRSGLLLLAAMEHGSEIRSPLEACALAAFVSLAESLQALYGGETMEVRLCRTSAPDVEGFARFLLDRADAPRLRRPRAGWQRYAARGRIGLFGR